MRGDNLYQQQRRGSYPTGEYDTTPNGEGRSLRRGSIGPNNVSQLPNQQELMQPVVKQQKSK